MKKLLLITLLFSLFSGCFFSKEDCDSYCDGDVAHTCEYYSSGMLSGRDCSEEGMVCVEIHQGAHCMFNSKNCDGSKENFCKNDQTIYYCFEYEGELYEKYDYDCHLKSQICIEFSTNALCLIPIDECDVEAESVCLDKYIGKCHEKDGSYYFEQIDFCEYNPGIDNKCIYDPETKSAHCLSDEE